jgi:hypothetical protein
MIGWMAVMGGVSLLFYFGGLLNNTPTSSLLVFVSNPNNAQNSDLYLAMIGLFSVIATIISTFVSRNANSDFWILVPVITVLFNFGWNFLSVYQILAASSDIGAVIATLIFGPIILMYLVSVVEWWRGTNA